MTVLLVCTLGACASATRRAPGTTGCCRLAPSTSPSGWHAVWLTLTCLLPLACFVAHPLPVVGVPAHLICRLLPHALQVTDQGTEGDEEQKKFLNYKYPNMSKTQGSFTLHVSCGRGTEQGRGRGTEKEGEEGEGGRGREREREGRGTEEKGEAGERAGGWLPGCPACG